MGTGLSGTNPTLSANLRSFVFSNLAGVVGSHAGNASEFSSVFSPLRRYKSGLYVPRGCARHPLNGPRDARGRAWRGPALAQGSDAAARVLLGSDFGCRWP